MRYHLLCLLFCVLAVHELWALPPCSAKGDATKDMLLQNGSSFTMSCNLTDAEDGLTVGIRKGKTWLLLDNSSRVVVWKKDNVQEDDRAIYYCVVRGDHCGPTPFSATSLAVAYAPIKPTKHWCIGHNLETFTCNWSIPKLWTNTTYSVQLRVGTQEMHGVINCEAMLVWNATNVTCRLMTAGRAIYRTEEKTLYFIVVANNTFGSEQWDYEVDHFQNVRLNALTGVRCEPSKDSIHVTWDGLQVVSSFPPVLYRVEVANHPQLTRHVTGDNYLTITDGPVPYTSYEITVRAKFDESNTWSPGSRTVTCTTSKARPTAVPKVAVNGFSMENYEEARNVRVYFQDVPKELWHGEEMRHVIVLLDGKDNHTMAALNGSNYELRELSHNKEYIVHIYSENEVGRSAGYATLTIPATNRLLPPVEDAYIDTSQVWSVQLHVRKMEDINATYTVFWRCGREENVALKSLSWKDLSSQDKEIDMASDPSPCIYAIASQKEGQISPMTWIDCVTPGSREYEELLTGTDRVFAAEVTDSSIRLAFLSKCNGLVTMRQIQYHAANDESYNVITLEDGREVTITELSSRTNYVLTISSFLEDGSVVLHQQLNLKTRSKALLMVAIGLCVGFLMIAIIGFILVAWCRRLSVQFIKYKAATVEVFVPADFSQRRLQRSDSIRSNYFPERSTYQMTSDSSPTSQSSDVPLLATDASVHTSPYVDDPNDDEKTTCDTAPGQATYSQLIDLTYRSSYAKVSDVILPLEDITHCTESSATARSADIDSSTKPPHYSKLSATMTSQQQNPSSQEPTAGCTAGCTAGYSSCFITPPYSQLSVMLVNKPPSVKQRTPDVTEGYSSFFTRPPYRKASATMTNQQQNHVQRRPDMTGRYSSSSPSEREATQPLSYFKLPAMSANQPGSSTSRESIADATESSCCVSELEDSHAPPYFKLSAMLASGSQNPTAKQPIEDNDPSDVVTGKPLPYFKLSAMIVKQQEREETIQQPRNSATITCSTTSFQHILADSTETLDNCDSESFMEQICQANECKDICSSKALAETESITNCNSVELWRLL